MRFSGVVTVLGDVNTETALDGEGDDEQAEEDEDASAESAGNSYDDDGKRVSLLDLVP